MTYLKVNEVVTGGVLRERDPSDEWDADDTWETHEMVSMILGNKRNYDVIIPVDMKVGDDVWLVWADYNTGDSFHRSDGVVQIIDAFSIEALAEGCAQKARDYNDATDRYLFNYVKEDLCEATMHVSWTGYFESLNSIKVKKLKIERK